MLLFAPVRFEAVYRKRLPAHHRASLTLLDKADDVLRDETLNTKKPAVELKLIATDVSKSASWCFPSVNSVTTMLKSGRLPGWF